MKRILYLLLIITSAPYLFLFSCDTPDTNDKNDDENDTGSVGTVTEPKEDIKPEAPFVFAYDFSGKTTALPAPTPEYLPSSWRGFNLLNMFYMDSSEDSGFEEGIFKMMAEWGFNFARLPMDYRIWIKSGDWNVIDEREIKRIDRALELGIKYDIHICLNFHRAPGFTVASPPEPTDLWTDAETQRVFADMWGFFAARYKNVPNEYLSFNFVNEPPDIDEAVYAAVIKKAADAIRAADPGRLLIADGLAWGNKPSYMIKELGIAQSTRGYTPFTLTHYRAEWAQGSDTFPLPTWPTVVMPQFLYSKWKSDVPWSAYVIEHDFTENYYLDVNVGTVSNEARLVAAADGETIYEYLIKSGPGEGDWKTEVYREEWDVYQNIFDKDYRIEIPAGTKLFTLEVTDGDWMTVNDMKFSPVSGGGVSFSLTPNNTDWGAEIPPVKIDAEGTVILEGGGVQNKDWLRENYLKPWEELKNSGCGVMVGEWGSYNKTPHGVTLRWMEDNLQNYKEIGLGWALWNFNASFGILDSYRDDVEYEKYNGYELDRKMLELLLKY